MESIKATDTILTDILVKALVDRNIIIYCVTYKKKSTVSYLTDKKHIDYTLEHDVIELVGKIIKLTAEKIFSQGDDYTFEGDECTLIVELPMGVKQIDLCSITDSLSLIN